MLINSLILIIIIYIIHPRMQENQQFQQNNKSEKKHLKIPSLEDISTIQKVQSQIQHPASNLKKIVYVFLVIIGMLGIPQTSRSMNIFLYVIGLVNLFHKQFNWEIVIVSVSMLALVHFFRKHQKLKQNAINQSNCQGIYSFMANFGWTQCCDYVTAIYYSQSLKTQLLNRKLSPAIRFDSKWLIIIEVIPNLIFQSLSAIRFGKLKDQICYIYLIGLGFNAAYFLSLLCLCFFKGIKA